MTDQTQHRQSTLSVPAADLVERTSKLHAAQFGCHAPVVGIAPGRVNLIGEHTDYSGGFVLPLAIDRWTVVTLSPSSGPLSGVFASDLNQHATIDTSKLLDAEEVRRTLPQWMWYVAGVIEHIRRFVGHTSIPPLNLTIASTVPAGAGLSSSAALEISTAAALVHALKLTVPPLELARIGRRAEHEFAGVPCGVMDQYISALGRADYALLIDCRDDTAQPVPLPPSSGRDGVAVVLVNSNVKHALPEGGYAVKVHACETAAKTLGLAQLRDANLQMLEQFAARLTPDQHAAASHVVSENQRVLDTVRSVQQANAGAITWSDALRTIGRLLQESHASLRDVYKVSCAELDTLVRLSLEVSGVHGARMTGAGFGGSIVALVRITDVERYTTVISKGYREATGSDCSVDVVRASTGACAFSV